MIPLKRQEHLEELVEKLGVQLNDCERLSVALTHPSYILGENASLSNNQRLEFLGDAVIDLVVGQFLFDEYPDKPEGELTKMRSALVCESSLANAARRLALNEYLLISKGEIGNGGYNRASADVCVSSTEYIKNITEYYLEYNKKFDINYWKLDGFLLKACPSKKHGHMTGGYNDMYQYVNIFSGKNRLHYLEYDLILWYGIRRKLHYLFCIFYFICIT